ncbi:hypothetical protein CLOHYLEM_04447 [[Clostridium] hylemonae DSM 15053]|uniref:Putative tail fiber protein gp53-like C-terminal domain-containing protein n=1 Tax=[Clostridium] hylemonae DSM 15053 TaxID=553973 RepID=C0BXB0_9FIRM|nr:hypothetical protein CLOHYLEM_04447 [[Clostridium] hylemonae DSM 15053]
MLIFVIFNYIKYKKNAELNHNLGFEYGVDDNRYYKKYNNGLLEMWGSVVIDKSSGYGTITFPMDYANKAFRVFATQCYNSSAVPVMICSAQQQSTSTCIIYGRTHDGKTPSVNTTVWWNSIGYWKV